jgi:hypothetical protein
MKEKQLVTLSCNYVFEKQNVSVSGVRGGNFIIIASGQQSEPIAWNANARTFKSALGSVRGCGDIEVTYAQVWPRRRRPRPRFSSLLPPRGSRH